MMRTSNKKDTIYKTDGYIQQQINQNTNYM